jgi:hypothetical protein
LSTDTSTPSITHGTLDHFRACSQVSRWRIGLQYSGVGDASMILMPKLRGAIDPQAPLPLEVDEEESGAARVEPPGARGRRTSRWAA